MNTNKYRFYILLIALWVVLAACPHKESDKGKISIQLTFAFDNAPLLFDVTSYYNTAGNLLEISEVKCFISEVILIDKDGATLSISDHTGIHYFDNTIYTSLLWQIKDSLPAKKYKTIRFRFGLSDAQNFTGAFPNSPETNFAWSPALGGGYHYLQINGKWNNQGLKEPFNLHTGRGQQRNSAGFIDNSFQIEASLNNFTVIPSQTTVLVLVMDIARWFDTPNVYDIAHFGNAIMENQMAQQALKENGKNVFTVK